MTHTEDIDPDSEREAQALLEEAERLLEEIKKRVERLREIVRLNKEGRGNETP